MARPKHKLTNAELKAKPPGKYSDGGGLCFMKRTDGGAQWFVRHTSSGRRHEMGLGSYPRITLKDARQDADKSQSVVWEGKDAIKERERLAREAERNLNVLRDVALDAFESRKAELKGDGKAGRGFSPLEIHILPKLGKMPVSQIDQRDIRNTLAPIWHGKADTTRKAMKGRKGATSDFRVPLSIEAQRVLHGARSALGQKRHEDFFECIEVDIPTEVS